MARIAFDSTSGNTGGGGWQPLPAGDYTVQFDAVEQTVSKQNNPQLQLSGHVVDGPHDGHKLKIWMSLVPQAAFRLEMLLAAALPADSYEQLDTGEVSVRKVGGQEVEEPIYSYSFDTDDLVGAQVIYAVTEGEYNGRKKNEFDSPRAVTVAPAKAAVGRPVAPSRPVALPPQRAAAPAAQPARRRVGG